MENCDFMFHKAIDKRTHTLLSHRNGIQCRAIQQGAEYILNGSIHAI
jgi:hypothetical protein